MTTPSAKPRLPRRDSADRVRLREDLDSLVSQAETAREAEELGRASDITHLLDCLQRCSARIRTCLQP